MTLAIEVKNLTKHYGKLLAVNHISFQVKEGELFGFLGPNGAGKTTTQRVLTGVIEANDGNAEIMGYDIQKEAFHAKSMMGIVPEMANPYIDLSAWDNLMLMGQLYGVSQERRKEKATLLLKMFELYERRNQKVKIFSKGMKQRLLLGMALISEPRILFLDEPTAGLDVQSAHFIRNLIGELNGEGITVFLTTHNLEEANQLCHRIAIIDHGKIATIDSPQNLRQAFQKMQSVEIGFTAPFDKIDLLEKLAAVSEVKKMGNIFRLYTKDPSRVIQELTNFAQAQNLRFTTLNTLGPSLEEVFIKITEEHIGRDYEK
jgi:ABC-2 type transport system ATP-binding protein